MRAPTIDSLLQISVGQLNNPSIAVTRYIVELERLRRLTRVRC